VIYFGVKDAPRGQSEPELVGLQAMGFYKFDWKIARDIFKKRSLLLIFAQGFFGVFPWNVITYWFFVYLEKERGYESNSILFTMVPAILILAAGYPIGGALGDFFYKRNPSGRAIVSTIGVLTGATLLWFTMQVPLGNQMLFMILLCATALFIPMASANVVAIVYDITLPEIRSTANAVESFIESGGAALAPLIAGVIADNSSLKSAILLICISTWLLCAILFAVTAFLLPKDMETLRSQMRLRAEDELSRQSNVS
jgi:MFS family permease